MRHLAAIWLVVCGGCLHDECADLVGTKSIGARIDGVTVKSGTPAAEIRVNASLSAYEAVSAHEGDVGDSRGCISELATIEGNAVVTGAGIQPVTLPLTAVGLYAGMVPYTTDFEIAFTERDGTLLHDDSFVAPELFTMTVDHSGGNLVGTISPPVLDDEVVTLSLHDCTHPEALAGAELMSSDRSRFISSLLDTNDAYRVTLSRGGQVSLSVYVNYTSPTGASCE